MDLDCSILHGDFVKYIRDKKLVSLEKMEKVKKWLATENIAPGMLPSSKTNASFSP